MTRRDTRSVVGQTGPARTVRGLKKPELTARAIVEEIAERDAQPGDVLPPEAAMLDHYGVGRATLREALRLLESQGLVQMRTGPGGGPIVGCSDPVNLSRTASLHFSFSGSTYGELAEALLLVDPWLAELAAAQPDRALVRKELEPFLDGETAHWGRIERSQYFRDFHDVVRQLSPNRVLSVWGQVIGVIYTDHIFRVVDFSAIHPKVGDAHVEIAKAIIAGRKTRARELSRAHLTDLVGFCNRAMPKLHKQKIKWI